MGSLCGSALEERRPVELAVAEAEGKQHGEPAGRRAAILKRAPGPRSRTYDSDCSALMSPHGPHFRKCLRCHLVLGQLERCRGTVRDGLLPGRTPSSSCSISACWAPWTFPSQGVHLGHACPLGCS